MVGRWEVKVPPAQPWPDEGGCHEGRGAPGEVDGTTAVNVDGAEPAEEAGAVPEQCANAQ